MPRPRHAKAKHDMPMQGKACQGQGMQGHAMPMPRHDMPKQAKATPCQASNSLTFSKRLELNGEQYQGQAKAKHIKAKACEGHDMRRPRQGMPRPRHAEACQRKAKACQGQGTTWQGKARQAEATTRQSQSHDKPKVSEGGAKRKQVRKNTSKCRMGSLAKFWGKVEWKRRGRDESKRRRAESQWIVAARPLCHLQYPVAYLSRLQRILPAAR